MINTKVTINGTEYTNFIETRVKVSMDEYIATSNFQIKFPSPFGRHSSDFNVGTEIVIFADKDTSPATTKIFTGIVEKVAFKGQGTNQTVTLSGRDLSARLQDVTAKPIVFTDSEVSTIIQNLLDDNIVTDITTNNLNVTETTLERISFNHVSLYDALNQLAEVSGHYWYIDADKDLHLELKKSTETGITFNNTNILKTRFNTTREGMANQVWVYGDRTLAGFREQFGADGGSSFIVQSKPHNTFVETAGAIQLGYIAQLNEVPPSGTNYTISFNDKEIIFISGPTLGDNVPASGGSVIISYDREIPIVKFGKNNSSIATYGLKERVIVDNNIKDPTTADKFLRTVLEDSSPFRGLELEVTGLFSVNPGDTVNVTLDDFGLEETGLDILRAEYTFNSKNVQSENVTKIKLDKKIPELTDKISDIDSRLRRLEAPSLGASELLTRLEFGDGEMRVIGSQWKVQTRDVSGGFVLGNPEFGILGSATLESPLGVTSNTFATIASGGGE